MEKEMNIIEIVADQNENSLCIYGTDDLLDKYKFEGSLDFCKWVLELARDIGIGRLEFASACNAVSDEIKDWGNLSGEEDKDERN